MNEKVFDQTQIVINGQIIKVEEHSILMSGVALMWIGKLPRKQLPQNVLLGLIVMLRPKDRLLLILHYTLGRCIRLFQKMLSLLIRCLNSLTKFLHQAQ